MPSVTELADKIAKTKLGMDMIKLQLREFL